MSDAGVTEALDNYVDTFILVADDCPVTTSAVPKPRGTKPTIPVLQYELLSQHPYTYTQQDVIYEVHRRHKGSDALSRDELLSTPQPCLRASPLAKKYGWGLHFDAEGRMALVAVESDDYRRFSGPGGPTPLKALRSSRA